MSLIGDPHLLTVYNENDYEIEHTNCPLLDSPLQDHECAVDYEIYAMGLWEALGEVLAPGMYTIQAWYERYYSWNYGTYEYNAGLTVID